MVSEASTEERREEKFQVVFDGGLASLGRLHFYEFGRSQYATARFVAVVEHFRQTGNVLSRVTASKYSLIYVETPDKGSFIQTVIIPGVQHGMATAVSLPLSTIISYIWHILVPRRASTDEALVDMARIRVAEAEQRTAQESERTAQEVERTKQLQSLTSAIEQGQVTTRQALELSAWALESTNPALGRAGFDQARLFSILDEIEAERARLQALDGKEEELDKIEPEKIARLAGRVRPFVPEMALPLRKSATTIAFKRREDANPVVKLDADAVRGIGAKSVSPELVEIDGYVRSFDRKTGAGKVIIADSVRVMSFSVPYSRRRVLNDGVLEAMRVSTARLLVRRVIDAGGETTSYILEDVVATEAD